MFEFDSTVSTPITSSASFSYKNSKEAEGIFSGEVNKPLYSRMGNPTTSVLEEQITRMEDGMGCVATSSGMGAISMAVASFCSSRDEVIAIGGLFGGSYALFSKTLSRYDIATHFLGADEIDKIDSIINENTKVIFCESIGNPNLRLPDMKKIGEIATKYGIAFMVDNTLTPVIVKPFLYGADMVLYSTTKIISGNSSALGGAVVVGDGLIDKFGTKRYKFLKSFRDKLGKRAMVGCLKKRALRDFGMSANAHSSYQTLLGLETLFLRLKRVESSAVIVAQKLYDAGLNINYPSLKDSVDNDIYNRQYQNGCGGMMTIDMGSKDKAFAFLDNSKLLTLTANLGDSRTLGLHMASTIYQDFNEDEKAFLGVTDGLIRLSIGLENPEDICDDLIECFKVSK
jgi:O-acetylhomoserine (thiol)-lyase